MRALIGVALAVLRDLIRIGFRTRAEIIAENLFLRRQLSLYQERKTRRRRPTPSAKLALVVLSRFFSWAPALAIVQSHSSGGTEPASDCSGGGFLIHAHAVVEHHERQPTVAFQRVLQMEPDYRLLLPILQPEIAGNPAVVLVHRGDT